MLLRFFRPRVLVLALAGAGVACAAPREPAAVGETRIELDAFSGRPNPRWTLSAAEAQALDRRLRDLPRAEGARLPETGLGYRGFRVEERRGGGPPRRLYVSSGLVVVESEQGEGTVYRDARGAEAWLVEQAGRRGYGGIFRGPRRP